MMKKINKYYSIAFICSFILFFSCETIELDKSSDPNALSTDQTNVDFFLNSIEEDFVRQLDGDGDYDDNDNFSSGGNTNGDGFNLFGMQLTRMTNLNGRNYNSAYQPIDGDDEWRNAYKGILLDIRLMTPLALESGQTRHIGIAQFIEAYTMVTLVDFFGDVPYADALKGLDGVLNPTVESGASIYDSALVLLDNAITNFSNTTTAEPANEVFYNNDYTKWVKAANTLKMKIYLQRRLVDASAIASFNAIVATGNYISSAADDLQYNWPATSATNPDTRHPRYGLNYTPTGAGDYLSNWFMNLMDVNNDPRRLYYFFRQTDAVPGAEIDPNEETLSCSLESAPAHYVNGNFTFCYLNNGYWGRDHGDDDGVPPDGNLRTTFGVYPAGGSFDDERFEAIGLGDGGAGKGITPILLSSFVDFMKAEVAMVQGNINDAKTFMSAGIQKSMDKVKTFAVLDPDADLTKEPAASDFTDYLTSVETAYDATTSVADKWNIISEQYFIALFGNGVESYNYYRRTGYPTSLQPNIEPNPGIFIRSLFYPANVVNTNSNVSQKSDQAQPVFWDTNATAPAAN